uniref:Uncharacterized protein LOC104245019 n=1 Tax=Nicotiana sylvestris TaxID=4096 RepID=A0A1U7YA97_NICSY|nr:PREDICTED: uncharacterized protein LOC104245019 [Nicotiana sylvestris]
MERFLSSVGKFSRKPQTYYHNEDYFVIRFSNLEERDQVLFSGPHTVNNKPIIMKACTEDFNVHDEVLKTISLWVRFPNLPLNCWSMKALSKIGSTLGNPVYADECTIETMRISYARMLIEMDITRPLPRSVKVQDPKGRLIQQEVVYDWEPTYCSKCLKIGHDCAVIKREPPQKMVQQRKVATGKQVWLRTDRNEAKEKKEAEQKKMIDTVQLGESEPTEKEVQRRDEGWITVLGKSAARAAKARQNEEQEDVGKKEAQSLENSTNYDEPGTSKRQMSSQGEQELYYKPLFIPI